MAGKTYYRIMRKDGLVWINPKTNEPELEKHFVSDDEVGFKDQRHKTSFPKAMTEDEVQAMLNGAPTPAQVQQAAPRVPVAAPVESAPASKMAQPALYRKR
jgi:hypothetical protein